MTPDKKNQTLHGVVTLLITLCLLMLFLRLWPVLLLIVPVLLGISLWELFHKQKPVEAPAPSVPDVPQDEPLPVSKQELITIAYGLLQRQITEQVTAVHPHAKWVWSQPGARERFAAGGPLTILLNDAGGYQKASVQVSDLQFYSLFYLPQNDAPVQDQIPVETDTAQDESVDYGLLAFEWVEANLQRLSALSNEAAGNGQTGFHIPAEELPHGSSWPSVCEELVRNGFAGADPVANGIQIQIKLQGEENQPE